MRMPITQPVTSSRRNSIINVNSGICLLGTTNGETVLIYHVPAFCSVIILCFIVSLTI